MSLYSLTGGLEISQLDNVIGGVVAGVVIVFIIIAIVVVILILFANRHRLGACTNVGMRPHAPVFRGHP